MAIKRITNAVLLEHIHGIKNDLQAQVTNLDKKLTKKIDEGFEDARLHRQALQEDLDASIAMLGRHQRKLARL